MPDMSSPRKPPRRFWLFAPYVIALIAALAWSAAWFVLSAAAVGRMDATAVRLRAKGWTVAWSARTVSGFPFRIDVSLRDPRLAEPSGWAIAAPRIDSEAYAYAPTHWVLVAPGGLTLTRPGRGAVVIAGHALRASVAASLDHRPPRVAIEGLGLTLTPAPGAKPLPISACDHLGLYLRPTAGDQAEFQLNLQGASPSAGALIERLAPGQTLSLVWDQSLTQVSALHGRTWPAAVQAWSAAGGGLVQAHGQLSAAGLDLTLSADRLTVGPDGRVEGPLSAKLHNGKGPLFVGEAAILASLFSTDMQLRDGALWLGPFKIAGAPRVYTPEPNAN